MDFQEIEVVIDKDGRVHLEVQGVKGPACLDLTRALEEALGGEVEERKMTPEADEQQRLIPLEAHGVKIMSMGLLTTKETPVIWRGPMATRLIQQFMSGVVWGELDYLVIDLPPGTGDVQLTLTQSVPLTGAVIVTTPQDVARSIAEKGLRMFRPPFRHHDLEQFPKRVWITNNRGKILFFTGQQPKPLRMDQHDARKMMVLALRTMIFSFLLLSVIGDVFNPDLPLSP